MADGMNFDKYIDNPSGGASVITNRNMYKSMYKEKFDKVLLREQGQIKYTIYKANDGKDSYYIHIKVPSEVIEKFYYDVVIRLFTTENQKKTKVNLREYAVQFYSNDPAFVYTFAHAFSKNNLFIDDLKSKMSKKALTTVAKEKNPKDNIWYVKSLYFAYLTMEKYNLFNRPVLDTNSKKYNAKDLIKEIEDADNKIKARQEAQVKLDEDKKKEKQKSANVRKPLEVDTKKSPASKTTAIVKTSAVTKSTKTSKRVKTIGMKKRGNG